MITPTSGGHPNPLRHSATCAGKPGRNVELAAEFAASTENVWKRTRAAIHETRNIADSWERMDVEDRRILFSHWVEEVHIVLEKLPDKNLAKTRRRWSGYGTSPGPITSLPGGTPVVERR